MNEPGTSLQSGIAAYKAGKKEEARAYLLKAVREQPNSEQAWGWLSNTTANNEERMHCLRQVMRINPGNAAAAKLLKKLESARHPKISPSTPQTAVTQKSLGNVLLVSLLLMGIIGALGASYYFYGPCGIKRVEIGGRALADQFSAYSAAYKTAEATSRIDLAGPITQLYQVKRDAQLTPVPVCLEGAKYELVQIIDNGINVFLSFSSHDDIGVDFYLSQSAAHMEEFRTQLEAVELCKPFCETR